MVPTSRPDLTHARELGFDVYVGNDDEGPARIHQAVGMLAGQLDWPVTDAFAQLRVYAHASHQSLEAAAADVVDGAVRLHAPPAGSELDGWLVVDRAASAARTATTATPAPTAATATRRPPAPALPERARPYDPAHACTTFARPRYTSTHLLADRRRPRGAGHSWVRAA